MFPRANHLPSCRAQFLRLPMISRHILSEFRQPIGLIALRIGRMEWTTMPKASVDKDCDFRRDKYNIDCYALYPAMQAKSQTTPVKRRT